MRFEEMNKEAQAVAKTMIEYCIDNCRKMGPGEGYGKNNRKLKFRKDLELFIKEAE